MRFASPQKQNGCSGEFSAGRMPMRQYHRTKVSVRANGIPWFSDARKRSMIPRSDPLFAGRFDGPEFHLNRQFAGVFIGFGRVCHEGIRGFSQISKGDERTERCARSPLENVGGKIGFRPFGRDARGSRAVNPPEVKWLPGSALTTNKSLRPTGNKSCLLFRPCSPASEHLRSLGIDTTHYEEAA